MAMRRIIRTTPGGFPSRWSSTKRRNNCVPTVLNSRLTSSQQGVGVAENASMLDPGQASQQYNKVVVVVVVVNTYDVNVCAVTVSAFSTLVL